MRHTKTLWLAALLVLAAACQDNGDRDIERAAKGYLDAMGNYRIEEAAPYATQHTREQTLPVMQQLARRSNQDYIKANTPADITIKRVRRIDDTTARAYYHKHTPIEEQDDSVTLLLEEGQWLVDLHLNPMPFFLSDSLPSAVKGDSILVGGRYYARDEMPRIVRK